MSKLLNIIFLEECPKPIKKLLRRQGIFVSSGTFPINFKLKALKIIKQNQAKGISTMGDKNFFGHKYTTLLFWQYYTNFKKGKSATSYFSKNFTIFSIIWIEVIRLIQRFINLSVFLDRDDPKYNFESIVTLMTKYSNFRRIIIEVERRGYQNGETRNGLLPSYFSLKIYFHLVYPMTVKMFKFFKDRNNLKQSGDDVNRLGERHPSWEDSRRDSRSALEINESPVFLVHLQALEVRHFRILL